MSTHAAIGMKKTNGSITTVFLEQHGYPGYTGVVLANWFTEIEKVQKLIDGGSLKFIEKETVHLSKNGIGITHKNYADLQAYLLSGESDFDCHFLYLFKHRKWFCHGIFEEEDWTDLQALWHKEGITEPAKFEPDLTLQEWRVIREKFPYDQTEILMIPWVSSTQFSIARYYGGCTFNGKEYTYVYPIDSLIRTDLFEWVRKKLR